MDKMPLSIFPAGLLVYRYATLTFKVNNFDHTFSVHVVFIYLANHCGYRANCDPVAWFNFGCFVHDKYPPN